MPASSRKRNPTASTAAPLPPARRRDYFCHHLLPQALPPHPPGWLCSHTPAVPNSITQYPRCQSYPSTPSSHSSSPRRHFRFHYVYSYPHTRAHTRTVAGRQADGEMHCSDALSGGCAGAGWLPMWVSVNRVARECDAPCSIERRAHGAFSLPRRARALSPPGAAARTNCTLSRPAAGGGSHRVLASVCLACERASFGFRLLSSSLSLARSMGIRGYCDYELATDHLPLVWLMLLELDN